MTQHLLSEYEDLTDFDLEFLVVTCVKRKRILHHKETNKEVWWVFSIFIWLSKGTKVLSVCKKTTDII